MRSGELAARLEVEAPHVTRQVQRLQHAGYVDRVPDPDDRRAQLIQLTPSGRAASDRIREAGTSSMQAALADRPPQELHQLATLLHRMVDDFLAYSAEEEREQPARGPRAPAKSVTHLPLRFRASPASLAFVRMRARSRRWPAARRGLGSAGIAPAQACVPLPICRPRPRPEACTHRRGNRRTQGWGSRPFLRTTDPWTRRMSCAE